MHRKPTRKVAAMRGHLETAAAGRIVLSDPERAHDEDPHLRIKAAESLALAQGRDAESVRTGVESRAGHVLGPVPVCIGLDDGPELSAPGRFAEPPDVPPQRREVDGDLRPAHRAER